MQAPLRTMILDAFPLDAFVMPSCRLPDGSLLNDDPEAQTNYQQSLLDSLDLAAAKVEDLRIGIVSISGFLICPGLPDGFNGALNSMTQLTHLDLGWFIPGFLPSATQLSHGMADTFDLSSKWRSSFLKSQWPNLVSLRLRGTLFSGPDLLSFLYVFLSINKCRLT